MKKKTIDVRSGGWRRERITGIPFTADGFPMFPGDWVYRVLTRDGGKTWVTSTRYQVGAIARNAVQTGYDGYWHSLGVGDNRLYLKRPNAVAEAKRRTKLMEAKGPKK